MLLGRLIAAATLIVGGVWLAASYKIIPISPDVASALYRIFFVLLVLRQIMNWRSRHIHPQTEPSPARSAVGVIVATGAVAVFVTARGAQTAPQYFVPAIIAVSTALLAFVTFRFVSSRADQIGEAKFHSSSNGS
ncbi:hypothetical protein [Sphingomonas sp.]|uniref:hypothetical protein n=1 Tax=Sphingomonas sp. TaxID=28214 RepID=UPI00333EB949